MMASKRMKAFLLLGAMLLSLVLCGCMAGKVTKPAERGHRIDESYIEGCDTAFMTESLEASAHPGIRNEEVEALFNEFFVGIEITNDSGRMDEVHRGSETAFPVHINFNHPDGTNPLTIMIYDDGTLGLLYKEEKYVSAKNGVVDPELLKEWFNK